MRQWNLIVLQENRDQWTWSCYDGDLMAQMPHDNMITLSTQLSCCGHLVSPGHWQGMQCSYKTYFYHIEPFCKSNCTLVSLEHKNDKSNYRIVLPMWTSSSHVFLRIVHNVRLFHDLSRSHGKLLVCSDIYMKRVGMWNRLETGCLSCQNNGTNMMQTCIKYELSGYWLRHGY